MRKKTRKKARKKKTGRIPRDILGGLYWKKDEQWFLPFQEHEDEIFRQIPHYKGIYFVSNYGRVISFCHTKPHQMTPVFKHGALIVTLSLDREREMFYIQDLVYKCFGGPMPGTAEVEHINGDTRDNRFKNLKLNKNPKKRLPLKMPQKAPAPLRAGKVHARCKEVLQFDTNGTYLKIFPSLKAAAASIDINQGAISACISKIMNTAGGFQWFLRKDPLFKDGIKNISSANLRYKEVLQFSLEGKYLRTFRSIREASQRTKIPLCGITSNLNGKSTEAHGFQFRLKRDPQFRFGIRDIPGVAPKSTIHPQARGVLQFDLYGRFIGEHASISDAARANGGSGPNIGACLHRRRQSAHGFQWYYRDHPRFRNGIGDIDALPDISGLQRPEILQFDTKGKYIRTFPNAVAAGKAVGVIRESILVCTYGKIKKTAGYQWRSITDPLFKDGIVDIPPVRYPPRKKAKAVLKYNRMGRLVAEFPTIQQAADDLGVSFSKMSSLIRGPIGETDEFSWEFRDN